MWLLFISNLLFAVNNALWKRFVRDVNPFYLIAKRALFTVSISGAAVFLMKADWVAFYQSPVFLRAAAGSFFGAVGLVFLVFSFKFGTMAQYSHYTLLSGLIFAIYTFFVESVPFQRYILSTIFITSGFILFLYAEGNEKPNKPLRLKQHLLQAGMFTSFLLSGVIQYNNLKKVEPILLISLQELVVLLVSVLVYLVPNKLKSFDFSGKVETWQTALMALVIFLAVLSASTGLKATNLFAASLIGLTGPFITVLSGVIFFHEKMHPRVIVSISLVFIGSFFL